MTPDFKKSYADHLRCHARVNPRTSAAAQTSRTLARRSLPRHGAFKARFRDRKSTIMKAKTDDFIDIEV